MILCMMDVADELLQGFFMAASRRPPFGVIFFLQLQLLSLSTLLVTILHAKAEPPPPNVDKDGLLPLLSLAPTIGWDPAGSPCGNTTHAPWAGVNCTAGRVTTLNLNSMPLNAPLPPELGSLTALTQLFLFNCSLRGPVPLTTLVNLVDLDSLDLGLNSLTGPIPPGLAVLRQLSALSLAANELEGTIPPSLGNLTRLTYLDLSENRISGSIPLALGNLPNLQWLMLGFNLLSGAIPRSFANLASLRQLNLTMNLLTGPIPPAFGSFSNLTDLDLSSNGFSGGIPPELGQMEGLQVLRLDGNRLNGPIPPQLGNCSNLFNLNVSSNALTGRLPAELAQLKSLAYLQVDFNRLTGPIPPQLAKMPELFWFSGRRNLFTGSLPKALFAAPQLWWVDLAENALTGSLPTHFGSASKLGAIILTNNSLSGSLPPSLAEVADLGTLQLDSNDLMGQIPRELGELSQMVTLDLSYNRLGGSIPAELGQLQHLMVLRLEHNELVGRIPAEVGNLKSLVTLTLHNNQLTGPMPLELTNLSTLMLLKLGPNPLTGTLSPDLAKLASLQYLSLSSTNLSGPIPKELGQMQQLVLLDLNDNELGGEIPPELGSLPNLSTLNLGSNDLSGSIPPELAKLSDLEALGLQENALEGEIPPELGSLPNLQVLSLGGNKLTGRIPAELAKLTRLTMLMLQGNQLTGPILPELGNLTALQSLYLSENNLNGSIPTQLSRLAPTLTLLYLTANELSGPIPPELGRLARLEDLGLAANQLTGRIPPELANLASLRYLSLSYNNLTGPIPPELAKLTNLTTLRLSYNQLSGQVPPGLGTLQTLQELSLPGNNLSGSIPETLAALPNLAVLSLAYNYLRGAIPFPLLALPENVTLLFDLNCLGLGSPGFYFSRGQRSADACAAFYPDLRCRCPAPLFIGTNGSCYCVRPFRASLRFNFVVQRSLQRPRSTEDLDTPSLMLSALFVEPIEVTKYVQNFTESLSSSLPQLEKLVNVSTTTLVAVGFSPHRSTNLIGYIQLDLAFLPLSGTEVSGGESRQITKGLREAQGLLSLPSFTDGFELVYAGVPQAPEVPSLPSKSGASLWRIIGPIIVLVSLSLLGVSATLFLMWRRKRPPQRGSFRGLDVYSFSELKAATEDFSSLIGGGGSALVFRGVLNGHPVAVKRLKRSAERKSSDREFRAEAAALGMLQHVNLVRLLGYSAETGRPQMLVYEFVAGGTLKSWLHGNSDGVKPPGAINFLLPARMGIALGIARGIEYCHHLIGHQPLVHRDIKPANILMDRRGVPKIADFGLAKIVRLVGGEEGGPTQGETGSAAAGPIEPQQSLATTETSATFTALSSKMMMMTMTTTMTGAWAGSLGYIDPEYIQTGVPTPKSDVYSFGTVLVELLLTTNIGDVYESFEEPHHLWLGTLLSQGPEAVVGVVEFFSKEKDIDPRQCMCAMTVAYKCLQDVGSNRPTMREVVRSLEDGLSPPS